MKKPGKIATKVNGLFAGIILMLGSVLGFYFVHYERGSLESRLTERAAILLSALRISSEYPLLIQNQETLHQLANSALTQRDVVYCRIQNKAGTLIIEAGSHSGESIKDFSTPVMSQKRASRTDEDVLLGISATEEEEIGQIQLGVSLVDFHQRIGRLERVFLLVIVLALILALVASSLMLRPTLGIPVARLVEATQRVAAGDLSAQVQVTSHDEMGWLASAFNAMTQNLQKVTVSKDYVDSIVRSMAHLLFVLDTDATIKAINPAVVEMLGYGETELLGKPVQTIFAQVREDDPVLRQLTHMTRVRNVEKEFRAKDGKVVPMLLAASTLMDTAGKIQGLILVAQDISERKRLEAIIGQSEKMSAVGQLAAGVAHEINNPLGIILGFAQGMHDRIKPGDPLELPIRSIEEEALRCKNLVQDLLTFSRTSRQDHQPIDLNEAVKGVLSLVEAKARILHATIQLDLAEKLPHVLGNKNQIQQIMINLVSNGMDALNNGGTLTLKTALEEDAKRGWVSLRVTDTGAGIPADVLPRIFEPFFTTKPVGKGTGLGLSLVYRIIQMHSATIDVQSRPGRTEFCVKFPIRTHEEEKEHLQMQRLEAEMPKPRTPYSKKESQS